MRCFDGHVHEGDYFRRYGYYPIDYQNLLKKHPHIKITWFPVECKYSACLPNEGYRNLGGMYDNEMECLEQAIIHFTMFRKLYLANLATIKITEHEGQVINGKILLRKARYSTTFKIHSGHYFYTYEEARDYINYHVKERLQKAKIEYNKAIADEFRASEL